MGHAADPDKLPKILGDRLRAIIGDDPGFGLRELLASPLQDQLHLRLGHRLAYIPMDHGSTIAVQNAA